MNSLFDAVGRCEDDLLVDNGASTLHHLEVLIPSDVFPAQKCHHPGELPVHGFVVEGARDPEADAVGVPVAAGQGVLLRDYRSGHLLGWHLHAGGTANV